MPLAFLSSDDSAALLLLVSSLICCSLTSKEQVILSRLSSIYIRVHELTCACALWQKREKARGSDVVQMFSCGHSEYIAHMEYIAHASVMSMAARRAGDGRTTIIIYRLRTFNSSMWGSLRLAPIIYRLRTFNSSNMWGSLRLAPMIVLCVHAYMYMCSHVYL